MIVGAAIALISGKRKTMAHPQPQNTNQCLTNMARTLIFLAALLISCVDRWDDDPVYSPNPIGTDIIIETREVLEPGARSVTLYCKTENIYSCSNYRILTNQTMHTNTITVTFTAIGMPRICSTMLGPATATVDLGRLPNGVYAFNLNNENLSNKGMLVVTETDISLQLESEEGIEIVRPITRRVPSNTYWGTIGYDDESSGLFQEVMESLAAAGAIFGNQTPGHYFYYEIDSSGSIVTPPGLFGRPLIRPFIFQYEGDKNKVYEVVKMYSEDISIRMESFQGN